MKNITIAGNCTKDAELRETGSGSKVAGFSVAVNGFANGEKTVDYFDVSMWGKRGEAIMQFAKKGSKICVSGELGTREYNGKTYLTVNASDFTPMGGGSDNSGNGYSSADQKHGGGYDQGGQPGGNGYGAGGQGGSRDLDGDDIPFLMEWRI